MVKRQSGLPGVVHYLDDFLFVGAAGSGHYQRLLTAFQQLTRELGVLLVQDKTEGPTQWLTFLGIELNTLAQTSCLPPS